MVNNAFEVKFNVNIDISLFFPDEGVEPDRKWIMGFIQNLGIDLPEDTPEDMYCMTLVKNAVCTKFGKAEIK